MAMFRFAHARVRRASRITTPAIGGALVAIAACADGTGPTTAAPAARVRATTEAVVVGLLDTVRLEAVATDTRNRVLRAPSLQWRSIDAQVASVVPTSGLVTALDTGTARVVVSTGTLADTVLVTVTRRVASIELVAADSVFIGSAAIAQAVARDARGEAIPGVPILWSTSDSTVAGVRDTGVVIGRALGQATVRARSGNAVAERVVRVTFAEYRPGFAPTAIAVGSGFTCALAADGQVYCRAATGFTPVATSERFTQLEGGNQTLCGITATGRLFCWGARSVPPNATVPTEVLAGTPVRAVGVGSEGVVCAVAIDGVAHCWGRNDAYQAGFDTLGTVSAPRALATTARFIDVAVGFHDSCALDTEGAPWCWGSIISETAAGAIPTRVSGAPPLVQVTPVAQFMACGLTSIAAGGETWCWGNLEWSPPGSARAAPTRVAGIPPMRELAASYAGVCGLGVDGEVWCWSNWTGWWTPTPFRWGAPHRFKQLDLGPVGPICGVTTDDRLLCTGNPAAR